ncbi:MAG: hypothetical protein AAF430_19560 [Myxococcota bacterium]
MEPIEQASNQTRVRCIECERTRLSSYFSANFLRTLTLVCLFGVVTQPAYASGVPGEHVKDLQAHLTHYEEEVHSILAQIDEMVSTYEKSGAKAAKPERVIDIWEGVDFHAAIETSYIPIYASIWQGLFGVRTAIEREAPIAEVRSEDAKLERVLWEALGAVKMAAKVQKQGGAAQTTTGKPTTPTATLVQVEQRLDRVVAKFAERLNDEAKSIVFDTYQDQFEGVEGALIELDAELVESLEVDFNVTLPQAIEKGESVDRVREIVEGMQTKLERARGLLAAAEKKRKPVF